MIPTYSVCTLLLLGRTLQIAEGNTEVIGGERQPHVPDAGVEIDAAGELQVRLARRHSTFSLAEDVEAMEPMPVPKPSAEHVPIGRESSVKPQTASHDTSDGNLILGLQPWALAVTISVAGSFFIVLGFAMQKKALADQQATRRWMQVGELVLSPMWLGGFIMGAIMPLPAEAAAYYLTSMSFLAPLSGVTVLLNQILAPCLLGERVHLWPDIPAAILIVFGVALTTATGRHDDGQGAGIDDLVRLGTNYHFLVGVAVLACLLTVSVVLMVLNRGVIEGTAKWRCSNPPINHVLLPAICAACTSTVTNLVLKASMGVLKSGAPFRVWALCLAQVGPLAFVQLQFINLGLRLYDQTIFFPLYSALLVVANTSVGILFYQDYVELLGNYNRCFLLCLGLALVGGGIACFHLRGPVSPLASMTDRMAAEYEQPRCGWCSFRKVPEPSLASRVPGMDRQG